MNSPSVASPPAASSDPPFRYPAANPATAATVPHTSASPNRARHARHHRPDLATVPRPAVPRAAPPRAAPPRAAPPRAAPPRAAPPRAAPPRAASPRTASLRTASPQPLAVCTFMLVPPASPVQMKGAREALKYG